MIIATITDCKRETIPLYSFRRCLKVEMKAMAKVILL